MMNNGGQPLDRQFNKLKHSSVEAVQLKVNNLNWHDQHIKTNLDTKITPLCQAAYLGRRRFVEVMLECFNFIDINLETKENGYTPISAACMAGNYDLDCLLAQNGADVNKVDFMEQSPLIYCFSRMNEDENYYENKSLALKMAEILLQHGANSNQLSHGRTILMNFCRQNYENMIKVQQTMLLEVIEYLILHGADPINIRCKVTGKNAYEFALQNLQETQKKSGVNDVGATKSNENIHTKIIDILVTTKQQHFHPVIIKTSPNQYRQTKKSSQYSAMVDNTQREMAGCCGCGSFSGMSLFQNLCKGNN